MENREKTFLSDKLVPTETSCWHTEKTSFDYGFNVLTKSADINNSVPSTSKPMKSYSKDPNNNEILYNSSINNNISALLKNFIIDTSDLPLFSNDVKQALLGKGNEAVLRLCFSHFHLEGVGGCSEPNETNFIWKKLSHFETIPLLIAYLKRQNP